MTDFIPYDTLTTDLAAAATAANLGFEKVLVDADARDFRADQAPLLDIRLKRLLPEAVTNATYYSDLILECEIFALDMTSRREAAKIRNDLLNALHRYVKDHPRFSGSVETTILGSVEFGSGESRAEGAFVAGAVFELHVKLYTE